MTVLFFSRLFYPHIGGVEKHVYRISQELIKRGYKVIVVTEKHDKSLKNKELYQGITIYRIPIGASERNKKFVIWKWLLKNRSLIAKADIVHCHDVFFWYFPFIILSPFKKVYTTFHGYEGNSIPTKRAKRMHEIAERLSEGNICIGDFFVKWYGTKPTYISYGATDIPKNNDVLSLKKKRLRAVFIGRLEEETGILEYLKTLYLLKKTVHIELEILGDGSQKADIEQYIKSNKLNAHVKGFVTNVEKFTKQADMVFVSRYLGILEAMAAEKPVYSLYNNAIKEDYLKMAPFANGIVIASSGQDLASKLQKDLSSNDYKKRIENGYTWIKQQTWQHLTDVYEELWKVQDNKVKKS